MIRYTKLGADGAPLADNATGHQAVQVERDILARPIIVANAMPPKGLNHQQAREWAASLTIYGWSWRFITFEELIMVPDYSRPECALDTNFFTEIDPDNWFWADTPYPRLAGYFRGVGLGSGVSNYGHQAYPLSRPGGPRRSVTRLSV